MFGLERIIAIPMMTRPKPEDTSFTGSVYIALTIKLVVGIGIRSKS